MEQPHVRNVLIDSGSNITYEVMAYRSLTREEIFQAVAVYKSQKGKKPKKNATIRIMTIIGL